LRDNIVKQLKNLQHFFPTTENAYKQLTHKPYKQFALIDLV